MLWSGGVLGFDTAGYLWEQITHAPDEVHLCVEHPVRSRAPRWVRIHRVAVPEWAATTRFGLPVTTRSWTLLDLVGVARPESEGSALLDRGRWREWITTETLDRRLRACPKRYGNGRLRRLQGQLADGAAARSERRLHRLLRRAGVTGWKPNHRVAIGGGEFVVADLAFPGLRLVIEVDGWAHHSDVDRFRRDRHKQNALVGSDGPSGVSPGPI